MHGVNTRGTFLTSKTCLPHLLKAANPHILNISPPLTMEPRWFARSRGLHDGQVRHEHVRAGHGRRVQARRASPSTRCGRAPAIATAAVHNLLGGDDAIRHCRKPEIMADAAHAILTRDSRECTGNFFIDDDVLRVRRRDRLRSIRRRARRGAAAGFFRVARAQFAGHPVPVALLPCPAVCARRRLVSSPRKGSAVSRSGARLSRSSPSQSCARCQHSRDRPYSQKTARQHAQDHGHEAGDHHAQANRVAEDRAHRFVARAPSRPG